MNRPITLLAAAALLSSPEAFAQAGASSTTQSEETIIIKRRSDQPQTTIEIGDGSVKVNGETVATLSDAGTKGKRKKIIIDSGDDATTFNFRRRGDFDNEPEDEREERSVVRKTVLGVLTESTQAMNGARVKQVIGGSAADEADLKAGDRIFRVNEKRIATSEDLVAVIGSHQPGDKVTIAYERGGKNRTATATLKAADPESTTLPGLPGGGRGWGDDMEGSMPNGMRVFPFGGDIHGFPDIEGMTRGAQRPKLGVSVEDRKEGEGVRVADVTAGSAAEEAGLKEEDIITHVDGEPIASVDDLQRSIRIAQPGDKLALRYERGGKQMKAEVTLPKNIRKRDL